MSNRIKGKAAITRFWVILAFLAIYVVWGTTYLANLYVLSALKPFVISGIRYLIAGFILSLIAFRKGHPFPAGKDLKILVLSGVLMLVGGSGLVVVAEQYVSSGYAAVIVATEPFWFILLDRSRWKTYMAKPGVIIGLVLGFAGILLFVHFTPKEKASDHTAAEQIKGLIIVLAGCVTWVVATLLTGRKINSEKFNLWHTTIQLIGAGIISILIASVTGEWSGFDVSIIPAKAWYGLAYLIVFGSLISYLAFAWLVTVQPPAIVSTHTYINPIIALFMGWLLANESVSFLQILALVVVLSGVVVTQRYKPKIE